MKNLLIVAMLVFSLGIVAAHDVGYKEKFSETKYYSGDSVVVSKTTWVYYKNEKRYSTYDYRHGYSYRATREYFEDKVEDRMKGHGKKYYSKGHGVRHFDSGLMGYRYEYVPHLRSHERRDCYVTPPADKLFYIKC